MWAHLSALDTPWRALSVVDTPAYEIRTGFTDATSSAGSVSTVLHDDQAAVIGWQQGPALGVYAHGLFESTAVLQTLFGAQVRTLGATLDGLADCRIGCSTRGR